MGQVPLPRPCPTAQEFPIHQMAQESECLVYIVKAVSLLANRSNTAAFITASRLAGRCRQGRHTLIYSSSGWKPV